MTAKGNEKGNVVPGTALGDASEPEKPRKKGGHAASVLLCGAIFIAAGLAAAYLAFARRVPVPSIGSSAVAGGEVPSLAGLPPAPRAGIPWRAWGAKAFDEANAADRLVLLDLTSTWSHWSKLMELGTYGDPAVADWIRGNVIPVRLDRDARPDLARRYGPAVPTTALLLPTGESLAEGSVIAPSAFLPWASRVSAAYQANREALAEARAAARKQASDKARDLLGRGSRDAAWKKRTPEERLEEALKAAREGLAALGRAETRERRFPSLHALLFLFELEPVRERFGMGDEVRLRARRLLEGLAKLEDPVWGGVYRYSRCADWSCPEHEKLLSSQALAIEAGAEASRRGHGLEWRELSRRTAAFVERRMRRRPNDYAPSIAADVESAGGWIDGRRYYGLGEAERLVWGEPAMDLALYSGPLAELAAAYLSTGQADLQAEGAGIVERLDGAAGRSGRLPRRLDVRGGEAGLLEDQLAAARAALASFRVTRRAEDHALAVRLMAYVSELMDPESGGLRVRTSGAPPAPGWTEPVDPDLTAQAGLLDVDPRAPAWALDWALARPGAVDPIVRARCALKWLRLNEVK